MCPSVCGGAATLTPPLVKMVYAYNPFKLAV